MTARSDTSDVIVIGAGLMGAASTLALARRGHAVTTLEARRPGHREGSSHGSSRIFRHSYHERHHVEMTKEALRLWRELEELCRVELLRPTGGLDHGEKRDVQGLHAALLAAGIRSELLTADAAGERWRHMRFETEVLYTPGAGVMAPGLAVAEMLRVAQGLGARIEYERPVLAVEATASGARVRTAAGAVDADVAVVAAGPWLPTLLAGTVALPPLTVTQQQVFHFARRETLDPGPWPVVLYDGELMAYALPGGRDGGVPGNMKLAQHDPGPMTTAGDRDGRIDPAGRQRVIEHARRWWPGLLPQPVAEFSCLYTLTPDEDFILDRVGPIVVCSPCSGHGAKFTPLIGEFVADLTEGRSLPYDVFGLADRF